MRRRIPIELDFWTDKGRTVGLRLISKDSELVRATRDPQLFAKWSALDALACTAAIFLNGILAGRIVSRAGLGLSSDLMSHFQLTLALEERGEFLYSFWYWLHKVLLSNVDPSERDQLLIQSGLFALGLIYTLKTLVLYLLLRRYYMPLLTFSLTVILCNVQALPTFGFDHFFYLGTLPPNVFHTATQAVANVAAIPAVLSLAFWAARPTRTSATWMILFGAISALAKPALTPSWLVAVGISSMLIFTGLIKPKRVGAEWHPLRGKELRPILLGASLATIVPVLTVFFVSFLYQGSRSSRSIGFQPFAVWGHYSNSILIDFLRSFLFPILAISFFLFSSRRTNDDLSRHFRVGTLPVVVTSVFSLIIFTFFTEVNPDGAPNLDGNFGWGVIAANAALHFWAVVLLSRVSLRPRLLCLGVLLLQFLASLVHQLNWLSSGNYI